MANLEKPASGSAPVVGPTTPAAAVPVISADRIFGGEREIIIEHAGIHYRLRITRRNKLILQK